MRLSRVFLWALLATVVLLAVVPAGLLAFSGGFGMGAEIIVVLTVSAGATLLVYFLGSFICAVARERGRWPRTMRSAMVLGGIAAGGWITLITANAYGYEPKTAGVLMFPSGWFVVVSLAASLLLMEVRDTRWRMTRRICIALLSVFAVVCAFIVLFYPAFSAGNFLEALSSEYDRRAVVWSWSTVLALGMGACIVAVAFEPRALLWRSVRLAVITALLMCAGGVTVIVGPDPWISNNGDWERQWEYTATAFRISWLVGLISAGSYVVTLATWFLQPRGLLQSEGQATPYWLCCPRCGEEQDAATGEHHCTRCGLSVRVELA